MRVIIYGAGAIGGVIGGNLALAGYPVIFIGRPRQVNAINESGLTVISPKGKSVVRAEAFTGPDKVAFTSGDAVFLTVKGQNTEEALIDLKKYIQRYSYLLLSKWGA